MKIIANLIFKRGISTATRWKIVGGGTELRKVDLGGHD
jgi:hypothetical protein